MELGVKWKGGKEVVEDARVYNEDCSKEIRIYVGGLLPNRD